MSDTEQKSRIALIQKNSRQGVAIELSEFMGHRLIQCRVVVLAAAGEPEKATKQAFALQIGKADELIEALQRALSEAVSRGWVE